MMKNNKQGENMNSKRTNRKELYKIVDFLKKMDSFKSDEEHEKEKEIQQNIDKSKKSKG